MLDKPGDLPTFNNRCLTFGIKVDTWISHAFSPFNECLMYKRSISFCLLVMIAFGVYGQQEEKEPEQLDEVVVTDSFSSCWS